jgi:hypothetical protein
MEVGHFENAKNARSRGDNREKCSRDKTPGRIESFVLNETASSLTREKEAELARNMVVPVEVEDEYGGNGKIKIIM